MRGSGPFARLFPRKSDGQTDPADAPADTTATQVIELEEPPAGHGSDQHRSTVPIPVSESQDPPDENVGVLLPFLVGLLPDSAGLRRGARIAVQLVRLSPHAKMGSPGAVPVVAALWAVAVGCLAGLLVGAAAAVADPVQAAPWLWLAANHVAVHTELGSVTLLPLGLMAIALLPLRRAGRFVAARTEQASLPGAAAAGVAVYAVAAAVIAAAWGGGHFSWFAAAPWAAVCAAAGGGWGISRARRAQRRSARPPVVTGVVRTAAAPLVLGLPLLAAALVGSRDAVGAVQSGVATGVWEHIGLLMLQVAYLPNLMIWTGSYVLGGGVSIGAEAVSPYSDGSPLLPDLPILQVMAADPPNWTAMLPIAAAIAAAFAAMLTNRRQPITSLGQRITRAVFISLGSGVVWLVLTLISGGSVGEQHLVLIGPAPITPVLAAAAALAGTLLWAILPTVASDARPVASDLRERVVKSKDTLVAASERKRG